MNRTVVGIIIASAGAGFIGWYLYQASNLKEIFVNGVTAKIQGGKIICRVGIHNPSKIPVTINGLKADLFLKGHNILDAVVTEPTILEPLKTTFIEIAIRWNPFSIIATIVEDGSDILDDLTHFNIADLDIMIKGNVFVTKSSINVPFEQKLIKDES